MKGVAPERSPETQAAIDQFKVDWAKRLEKPLPELFPSTLHHHVDECWSEPYVTSIPATGWFSMTVQRCATTGTLREVKP